MYCVYLGTRIVLSKRNKKKIQKYDRMKFERNDTYDSDNICIVLVEIRKKQI